MLDRLRKYQDEYKALSAVEGKAYIVRLDKDRAIRKEVAILGKHFLNRTVSNCGWCYIELHLLLMKLNPDNMTEKTMEYQLRAGTLLHDPVNREVAEILTPHSLTEERALRHLAYNPKARQYFTVLPADIDARIASYLNGGEVEEVEKPKRVRRTKAEIEAANSEVKAEEPAEEEKEVLEDLV